jgi:VanW like protein/putative peptidoglycan binding protein
LHRWDGRGTLIAMGLGGVWSWLAPLVLVLGGSAAGLSSVGLRSGAAAPGVSIAGAPLTGGSAAGGRAVVGAAELERRVRELADRVEATPFVLRVDSESGPELTATLGAVGVRVDVDATLRRARAIGRRGSPVARWRELRAVRERGLDVPLELGFEPRALYERLAPIKARHDRAPVPARYPSSGVLQPHTPGRALDLARAADEVWCLAVDQASRLGAEGAQPAPAVIAVATVTLTPRVNADALAHFAPRQLIGAYSTRFRVQGDQATRAANIRVAAARLDGLVLLPGDRVSFNAIVGERSIENGFLQSWELMDGEFVRGVGGGTCQVSSTLNAAALRAGLRVIEAYTHSRPLAYIEPGLDATVAWPFVDLKLENTWSVPVAIQTRVEGNRLDVRVLAESSPGRVVMRSQVQETYPFPRLVEVGRVARGSYQLKQPGIVGSRIARTRSIWPRQGGMLREVTYKRYKPTPELFVVAPGFDLAELPPLTEGAEGYDPSLAPAPQGGEAEGPASAAGVEATANEVEPEGRDNGGRTSSARHSGSHRSRRRP